MTLEEKNFDGPVESPQAVTPAHAGVYDPIEITGPRLRGEDERITDAIFYERINFGVK